MADRERRRERDRRDSRDDGRSDAHVWVPRVLAPAAFLVGATILVLIVHGSLNSTPREEATSPPPAAASATGTGQTATGTTPPSRRRFYRIRSGDTLDQIALRFDTTVDDLLQLNPGIEANALTPGQRIRVR